MFKLHRKSSVAVYVRHRGTCPHREDESYPRCDCAKWLRFSLRGQQHRRPAGTRTWGIAEDAARDLQKKLDAGEVPGEVQAVQQGAGQPIRAAVETFIMAKRGEGVGPATISKAAHSRAGVWQLKTVAS